MFNKCFSKWKHRKCSNNCWTNVSVANVQLLSFNRKWKHLTETIETIETIVSKSLVIPSGIPNLWPPPLCFRLQQPRCWNLKPQGQWTDGRIKCYRLQQKVMFKIFIPDINTTFLSTWHENHWKHVISSDPQSSPHPQVLAATIRRKKSKYTQELWLVVGRFLSSLVAAGMVYKDLSTTSPSVS